MAPVGQTCDADPAADAAVLIDPRPVFLFVEQDGRTFERVDAGPAADAVVRDAHREDGLRLARRPVHDAGVLGDEDGDVALGRPDEGVRLPERRGEGLDVVGVDLPEVPDAAGPDEVGDEDLPPGASVRPDAELGGRLVAGHGGRRVVEDDEDEARPLEDGVDEARDPRMEEGGIADRDDDRREIAPLGGIGVVEARPLADAGAHAVAGVHGAEVHPQGVAADVAGENPCGKGVADRIEGRPVAATRAERRADPLLGGRSGRGRGEIEEFPEDLLDDVGRQLPLPGNVAGAPAADPAVGRAASRSRRPSPPGRGPSRSASGSPR